MFVEIVVNAVGRNRAVFGNQRFILDPEKRQDRLNILVGKGNVFRFVLEKLERRLQSRIFVPGREIFLAVNRCDFALRLRFRLIVAILKLILKLVGYEILVFVRKVAHLHRGAFFVGHRPVVLHDRLDQPHLCGRQVFI